MRRVLARRYHLAKFSRTAVLAIISLAAISPLRSLANTSTNPVGNNDPLWMRLSFHQDGGITDIEKYATAQVQPEYPQTAQKYRIEGTVSVQVAVNSDGKVTKAEFKRGHSVFKTASLEAAKQWQFKSPDNGDMQGTISFTFKLKS